MGKSIFMTGASSGIGKALAFELAKRGYALGLTARRLDQLQSIQQDIQTQYPSSTVAIRELDVTQYAEITKVLNELAEELKGLDIVFANAGIAQSGLAGKHPFHHAQKTIETNLIGAMATVDAGVAYFLKRGKGGHIVGTSSVAAFRGLPKNSAYCASKAGFSTYLESVQAEVMKQKIDVTILHPGFIDTPLNDMMPSRPFVITVEKGAILIADLIEKRVPHSVVPAMPWRMVAPLIKLLPSSFFARAK